MAKVGRNEKCPCRSGFKYKYCCGASSPSQRRSIPSFSSGEVPPEVRRAVIEHQRKEAERIRNFGHGRPIISTDFHGYKVVAVGNTIHYSKSWKTFHDFLGDYVKKVIGSEWGNAELKEPFEQRHPIIQWYRDVCDLQHRTIKEPGKVQSAVATGPVMAYMSLAYDLYTLEHHALLRKKLINRLKVNAQFQGARYETYVAAAFVRAWFDVVLEDEGNSATTHCEFTATHRGTGLKYSVEAKSRHRPGLLGQPGQQQPLEQIEADVYRLLQGALSKRAEHDRIIFVDVNVPPHNGAPFEAQWFKKVAEQLKRLEEGQSAEDPWPSAFVFFTNHPYHYVGNDAPEPGRTFIFTAINMPEFKGADPSVVRKYPEINQVLDSVLNHTKIPHEF